MAEGAPQAPDSGPGDREPAGDERGPEEVLSDLFQRFRGRNATYAGRPRRRRPPAQAPRQPEPKGPRSFDWALIEELERHDGERDVPGAPSSRTGGPTPSPQPSRNDPRLVGNIALNEVRERSWTRSLAAGKVVGRWSDIVGDLVAGHCPVESFEEGKLVVRANSTAWAVQLRLMIPQVMARIDEEVGPGVVDTLVVLAPKAPSWSHGPLRVPGRGPRDTYG